MSNLTLPKILVISTSYSASALSAAVGFSVTSSYTISPSYSVYLSS
ncbi:hypothetical protein [Clostridium sp. BJN0013]